MGLNKILPDKVFIAGVNFLIKRKFNVSIGRGSRVYLDSFFEGHNSVGNDCQVSQSYLGLASYIANSSIIRFAKIGRFCCIGDNVKIGVGTHPSKNFVSIHPAFYSTKKIIDFTFTDSQKFKEHLFIDPSEKYVVEIGSDVWIASNVLIVDGVKIGNGAIIAAGSVVTKDVPDYAVVGGVPAKFIRNRFSDEQISFLLKFKWWEKDLEWLKNNHEDFLNIEKLMAKYGTK